MCVFCVVSCCYDEYSDTNLHAYVAASPQFIQLKLVLEIVVVTFFFVDMYLMLYVCRLVCLPVCDPQSYKLSF